MNITQLLQFAVTEGASDVHISAGEPPILRIHGDMKKLEYDPLQDEEVHRMIYDIMSDKQRKNFEELHELDFSLSWETLAVSVSMPFCSAEVKPPSFGPSPPRS